MKIKLLVTIFTGLAGDGHIPFNHIPQAGIDGSGCECVKLKPNPLFLFLSTKEKFLPIASHDLSDHKSAHHPDHSLSRNNAELHEEVRFSSSFFREIVCLEVLSDTRLCMS